jgi:hypothetical protein
VYTRPAIVHEILDAVGWTADADLSQSRLLEPAAGDGAFLVAAVARLLSSMRLRGHPTTITTLVDRICSFEIHPREARLARARLVDVMAQHGLSPKVRQSLATRWIITADFLLTDISDRSFSHIVGNPPYSRWSKIPNVLRRRYERHLPLRMAKGDLFLPFLDLSIGHLVPGGRLGFVCSDRWKYMAFAEEFRRARLPEVTVERDKSVDADCAYLRDVDVYPSILVLRRKKRLSSRTRLCDFERKCTLSNAGYVIRVGPALGCTPAFVLEPEEFDVEEELLAPWIDTSEIQEGAVHWQGRRIITLHDAEGQLRNPHNYPQLAARLRRHRKLLQRRAIVSSGAPWYRTIDRVVATDWRRPKLVLPEMAKTPRVAIDRSGAIPSHGIYAIFAPDDNVDFLYELLGRGALAQALSGIAPMVKGGYMRCYRRFLAQISI